jgi:hypothetical protein
MAKLAAGKSGSSWCYPSVRVLSGMSARLRAVPIRLLIPLRAPSPCETARTFPEPLNCLSTGHDAFIPGPTLRFTARQASSNLRGRYRARHRPAVGQINLGFSCPARGANRTERRHVAGLHLPNGLTRQHADAPA